VRTTTSSRDDLTTAPQGLTKKQWNTTDSEVGESVTPSHTINRSGQTRQCHPAHRWIEAKTGRLSFLWNSGVTTEEMANDPAAGD
jgi:hypothetical protein